MTKRLKLDAGTVDQLLGGELQPDDAPPELAKVTALFAAAAEVPAGATADPAFVAALAAEVHATPVTTPTTRRKPVLAKFLTLKAGVLVGVLAFGAASAAAATNSLPDSAQHGVATAAKHVGLNLPDKANDHARDASSKDHPAATHDSDEPTTTVVHGKPDDNHGADVSDVAHNTDTTGADHGAAVCAVASDGKCTDHRGSNDANENENENEHSTTTAVTVPEHHDDGATNGAGDHRGDSSNDSTSGSSESSSHGGSSNSGRD